MPAPHTQQARTNKPAAAFALPVLVTFLAITTAARAALPNCAPAASAGWGSSYQGRWTLNMPPNVWVDNVGSRPPGPLTVVNDIMYVKVRSHHLPGWGAAGLQVLNISSGTWLGTLWPPNQHRSSTAASDADGAGSNSAAAGAGDADGASIHYPMPTVPLRVLDADGARNTHIAFFSARAPNGTTLVHAAVFGSFVPATGPAITGGVQINATTGAVIEPPLGRPILGFVWIQAYGSPDDNSMLTDPALFDSLDPDSESQQPTDGGGRRVNFRGLAVFPTANNTLLAFNLATRTLAWEAAFPVSAFSSLQVSTERLLVRLTKPSTTPGYPYYSVSVAGEVRGFEIDPALSSLSSPYTTNPRSPLTPEGIHFTFLDADRPNQPQRIGITDLVTLEQRLLTLDATIRYPPVPPAISYDSCRLVVYGNGYVMDNDALPPVIPAVHVIDVATGAIIWRKELLALTDGEDSFVQHPHIDPKTGSIYLLQNELLWRFDAVPERPDLSPPPPALTPSPSPSPAPSPAQSPSPAPSPAASPEPSPTPEPAPQATPSPTARPPSPRHRRRPPARRPPPRPATRSRRHLRHL
eukprot:XP_001699286.1 predicted protein [Chlamydomonas reinhardtii]